MTPVPTPLAEALNGVAGTVNRVNEAALDPIRAALSDIGAEK